jgi:hypothetical protein
MVAGRLNGDACEPNKEDYSWLDIVELYVGIAGEKV